MKRFTSILFSLLCIGYAQAQVVQWLVPPEYDFIAMPSSDEGNLIVAQQGFNHHLWTMDGKCVAKISDDLFPYSEGFAVATEPETANLTAIYDARGNKTSVSDYGLQVGWGYTSFHDGFLLVHDGNYFYYMDPNGGVDETPYYRAYPFSHGYAVVYSFANMKKLKDPFWLLLNVDLQSVPLVYEGKEFRTDDIEFISSVSDKGQAIVVAKGKLYNFNAATKEMTPFMATEEDTNIKNQGRLDGSFEESFHQKGDSCFVMKAKCGKSRVTINFDAMTYRPISISSDQGERILKNGAASNGGRSSALRGVKDNATGKFALYIGDNELLPAQLDMVEKCIGNDAWVIFNNKTGLLRVHPDDHFTFSFNDDNPVAFRHKHSKTNIRLNMPAYVDANATSIEIDPNTGCDIDKRTKEAKNSSDGSYVQYSCMLDCPSDITQNYKDLVYPAYIVYQGLRTPMTQATGMGWHSKYFTVNVNEKEIKMTGNTITFNVDIRADRIPGEEVYPFVPSLATEGLRYVMKNISDTRYECTVYELKKGVNNIIVRVEEEGCPPSDYTFEVSYTPQAPQTQHKVVIKKREEATPPPPPARPVLRI